MLTELTKKVSRQQLYLCGYYTREEIYYLRKDGWRVLWRDKTQLAPKPRKQNTQCNRHGIPIGRAV